MGPSVISALVPIVYNDVVNGQGFPEALFFRRRGKPPPPPKALKPAGTLMVDFDHINKVVKQLIEKGYWFTIWSESSI